jgi:hypothetical protein
MDTNSKVWRSITGQTPSGRTNISRRREQDQIDQRVRNGDLRPGQRSLNDGPLSW